MNIEIIIFEVIVLLFSVIIHEVSHGFIAEYFGDDTARRMGRLTLNPIKHLDPIGSVLVPLVLASFGGIVFGWAKPVPFNPRNLKNPERDSALIALAGPVSNIIVAIVFGILYRILIIVSLPVVIMSTISIFFAFIIQINIVLAIFNLIPIPPLDGSKVFFPLLPHSAYKFKIILERYGFFILLFVIFFIGIDFIFPIINFLYRLLIGI